ncbi:hypothetical protein, partial [Accumulibacter sp.]|uniref:hypothetical protein n=1 Tax=Accumulibacter sp. TaxID=2053492 RepID=UPI002D1F9B65
MSGDEAIQGRAPRLLDQRVGWVDEGNPVAITIIKQRLGSALSFNHSGDLPFLLPPMLGFVPQPSLRADSSIICLDRCPLDPGAEVHPGKSQRSSIRGQEACSLIVAHRPSIRQFSFC